MHNNFWFTITYFPCVGHSGLGLKRLNSANSIDSDINNADCEDNGSPRNRLVGNPSTNSSKLARNSSGSNNQRYMGFGPQQPDMSTSDGLYDVQEEPHWEISGGLKSIDENDVLISIIKGGRRQYVRKVDYLVDELIRKKASRSFGNGGLIDGENELMAIPSYVGPSPRDDQLLSLILPPPPLASPPSLVPIVEVEDDIHSSPPTSTKTNQLGSNNTRNRSSTHPVTPFTRNAFYSGERTHTDWEMEEIDPVLSSLPSNRNSSSSSARRGVGDTLNSFYHDLASIQEQDRENDNDRNDESYPSDSDMACCDDWSGSRRCSDVSDEHDESQYGNAFYQNGSNPSSYGQMGEGGMMMEQEQEDVNNNSSGTDMTESTVNSNGRRMGRGILPHHQDAPDTPSPSSNFFGFGSEQQADSLVSVRPAIFASGSSVGAVTLQKQHSFGHHRIDAPNQPGGHLNVKSHNQAALGHHHHQHLHNNQTAGIHYAQSFLNMAGNDGSSEISVDTSNHSFAMHGTSINSFLNSGLRQSFYNTNGQQISPTSASTTADAAWSQLANKHFSSQSGSVKLTKSNSRQQLGDNGYFIGGYANDDDDDDVVHVGTFG